MANNNINFNLVGVKEITAILDQLPRKVTASILRSYNRKTASKFITKPLRVALGYSKNTTKDIKVRTSRKNKTAIKVGPTSDSFWLRFLEGGTVMRKTKKGAARGRVRGRKIIEPFVDRQIPAIIDNLNTNYGKEIDQFLRKKIKRINKKFK